MSTDVICIEIDTPGAEVLERFARHSIHHLPVVQGPRVAGMLSASDVTKVESLLRKRGLITPEYLNQHVRVEALMRRPAITVAPDATVDTAAHLMARHGVHALPVTDAGDRLLGIITTTDICYAALQSRDPAASAAPAPAAAPAASAAVAAVPVPLAHLRALELVLDCADRYLRAGQDERLHAALLRAIEAARAGRTLQRL